MELFGSGSAAGAAEQARLNLKAWEAGLALRISLQKSLDICNKLPVFSSGNEADTEGGVASEAIQSRLADMIELMEAQQAGPQQKGSKKRKFDVLSADEDEIWEHMSSIQSSLDEKWRPIVDKWHARLNYGSEKSKSKLKILSSTIWDQIDRTLSDETMVIEKSRPLLLASKRPDKPSNEHNPASARDEEVYDDIHFYSMLLKVKMDIYKYIIIITTCNIAKIPFIRC
jgi:hypothetical protein